MWYKLSRALHYNIPHRKGASRSSKAPLLAPKTFLVLHFKRNKHPFQLPTRLNAANMETCGRCREEVYFKSMKMHAEEFCERRLLSCPYCESGVEARNLETHMEECDARPANCIHCSAEFDSFAELRDNHLNVCPEKCSKYSYQRSDCKNQVSNRQTEDHVVPASHVRELMKRIHDLEEKVQASIQQMEQQVGHANVLKAHIEELKTEVQELRAENDVLKKTVYDIEVAQKTEQYLRVNMNDTVECLREQMGELHAIVLQKEEDMNKSSD
ncbi:TNF receptor-associated factor 3-like isoform X3 [Amblyomma americanum]